MQKSIRQARFETTKRGKSGFETTKRGISSLFLQNLNFAKFRTIFLHNTSRRLLLNTLFIQRLQIEIVASSMVLLSFLEILKKFFL